MQNFDVSANALYAGGWRSSDREELQAEFQLDTEDLDIICDLLDEIERG